MVEKPDLHRIAEDLFELFRGDDTRFGTVVSQLRLVGDKMEMKGADGKGPRDVKRPPTAADVLGHLEGGRMIGFWPARKDGMARRVCIDVDGNDQVGGYPAISQRAVVDQIEKLGLPLVDTQSKSKGLHLDCFFDQWVPQARANALGRQMAVLLGFPDAEVFPAASGPSNWVILPYYGHAVAGRETNMCCLPRDWRQTDKLWMKLAEYRDFAKSRRTPVEEGEAAVGKAQAAGRTTRRDKAAADGPARAKRDLEAFAAEIAGAVEGTRAKLLYGRAKDMGAMVAAKWIGESEARDTLLWAAAKCGLTQEEASGHIRNGLEDGKKEEPADNDVVFAAITDMIVWEGGDETEWEFDTGHGRIRMAVAHAMHQWTFGTRCGSELGVVFQPVKQPEWHKRLNAARRVAEVRQVPRDETPAGMLHDTLRDYLKGKKLDEFADDITLLATKQAVLMNAEGRIYFQFGKLFRYLIDDRVFSGWSKKKVGDLLRKLGEWGVDFGKTTKLKMEVFWVRVGFFDIYAPPPQRPPPEQPL